MAPGSTYLPAEAAEERTALAALRRFRRPCMGLAAPERCRPSKPKIEDIRVSAFSLFHPYPIGTPAMPATRNHALLSLTARRAKAKRPIPAGISGWGSITRN